MSDVAWDAYAESLREKAVWIWQTLAELDPDAGIELIHDALVDTALGATQ